MATTATRSTIDTEAIAAATRGRVIVRHEPNAILLWDSASKGHVYDVRVAVDPDADEELDDSGLCHLDGDDRQDLKASIVANMRRAAAELTSLADIVEKL